jgi:hypothetical protein
MKYEIKDFIGVFDNVFDREACKKLISYYETMTKAGYGIKRTSQENVTSTSIDGNQIFFTNTISMVGAPGVDDVLGPIWQCYNLYAEKYGSLKTEEPQHIFETKIQKTEPGQGYHVWHYETSNRYTANRLFNYHIYLNTVEEGGETEFLYLGRRLKPVEGQVIIYPAHFTHTHRGNPPLSGPKYLLNGWIEF